tara:strand:+ start:183 stop:1037 length:855 start_codon:yes stop_codon:yes gene_type:complete
MNLKKIYYTLPVFIRSSIQYFVDKLDNKIVDDFINNDYGKEYGITKKDRKIILSRILKILKNINSATSIQVLITLIKEILSIPINSKGVLIECGSFEGASTSVMSIGAKLINKKLIVYDSFEGLPDVESTKPRLYPYISVYGYYSKGMYSATEETVKTNLKLYGEIDNVIIRKGFFDETLPNHKEEISFIFMDVDLSSSTKTCIKYLWPKLNDNSFVYTDDACDMEVVNIWFDNNWWNKNLSQNAPGYIGGGCGLPITNNYSSLGFSFKNLDNKNYKKVSWLKY